MVPALVFASAALLSSQPMPPAVDLADNPPSTNLFVNGSFELPVLPSSQFVSYVVGSSGLTGWTIAPGCSLNRSRGMEVPDPFANVSC